MNLRCDKEYAMAETPFMLVEREGPVVIATLNRPDTRNAITDTAHSEEIADFCTRMTRDRSVRAIVLTGAGSAFCAGGNVEHMLEKKGMFAGARFLLFAIPTAPASS